MSCPDNGKIQRCCYLRQGLLLWCAVPAYAADTFVVFPGVVPSLKQPFAELFNAKLEVAFSEEIKGGRMAVPAKSESFPSEAEYRVTYGAAPARAHVIG